MSNAVVFVTFKLAEGSSVPDFLLAAEKLNKEFMSKQKGYISWKLLVEGNVWADLLVWETMEDAQNAMQAGCTTPLAPEFFSFMDPESTKTYTFSTEKSN